MVEHNARDGRVTLVLVFPSLGHQAVQIKHLHNVASWCTNHSDASHPPCKQGLGKCGKREIKHGNKHHQHQTAIPSSRWVCGRQSNGLKLAKFPDIVQ